MSNIKIGLGALAVFTLQLPVVAQQLPSVPQRHPTPKPSQSVQAAIAKQTFILIPPPGAVPYADPLIVAALTKAQGTLRSEILGVYMDSADVNRLHQMTKASDVSPLGFACVSIIKGDRESETSDKEFTAIKAVLVKYGKQLVADELAPVKDSEKPVNSVLGTVGVSVDNRKVTLETPGFVDQGDHFITSAIITQGGKVTGPGFGFTASYYGLSSTVLVKKHMLSLYLAKPMSATGDNASVRKQMAGWVAAFLKANE